MKFVCVLSVLALLAISHGVSNAAIVNLDLQVNQTAKTYSVYASINDLTFDGLASFQINVLGSGGASVTSAALGSALRVFDPSFNGGDFRGFSLLRDPGTVSGTNVNSIRASQDTVSSLANSAVIRDFGITAPVLLATGTYTGTDGSLTAQLSPGFFFNLLPDNWNGPGGTVAATAVNSSSVTLTPVPEPSTLAIAGLVVMGGVLLRRRRNFRQLDSIQE